MLVTNSKRISETWFNKDIIREVSTNKTDFRGFKDVLGDVKKLLQIMVHYKSSTKGFEQVVKIKGNANKILTKEIISELLLEIKNNQIVLNKVAVDYVVPNIYFWFEIKDNDFESCDKIEEVIERLNSKFKPSEFILKSLINEESLQLKTPDSFLVIGDM